MITVGGTRPAELEWMRRVVRAVLIALVVAYPFFIERAGMIDQDNYEQYFLNGAKLGWSDLLPRELTAVQSWLLWVIEEPLWLLWTAFVSKVFNPEAATYLTVALLNSFVALGVRTYRNPSLALLLWILLPFGFAVIGTYQIRQGLAFGLWLFVSGRYGKPVVAAICASLVHTTFLPLVPITWLAYRERWPAGVRLAIIAGFSLAVALLGQHLFDSYFGRRTQIYSGDEHAFSANFAYGLAVLAALPLAQLFERQTSRPAASVACRSFCADYEVFYLGLLAYLFICWALFPLGIYRISYLALLGLIPLFGQCLRVRPGLPLTRDLSVKIALFLMLAFLGYTIARTYSTDGYACALPSGCGRLVNR